jgi:hypothetical protein
MVKVLRKINDHKCFDSEWVIKTKEDHLLTDKKKSAISACWATPRLRRLSISLSPLPRSTGSPLFSPSSFPGGDDWAGGALHHIFAGSFAGDEPTISLAAPTLPGFTSSLSVFPGGALRPSLGLLPATNPPGMPAARPFSSLPALRNGAPHTLL